MIVLRVNVLFIEHRLANFCILVKVTLAGKNFWRDAGNQIWLKNNFYGQSDQFDWVLLTQTTKREIVIS